MFEKTNPKIDLNIFYIKEKGACPAINSNCKNQIILLMIPNEEQEDWHYLAIKKYLHNYDDDFYCLNYLHSFRTENKLKFHGKVYKNKDFCEIIMLSEWNNILEFSQYTKSDKVPYIICVDIASLIKTIDGCANNSKNEQICEYIPRRYSTS